MITTATIQLIVLVTAAFAGVVFAVAFKYALREACAELSESDNPLPPATLRNDGHLSRRVRARAWSKRTALSGVRLLQAGFIAFGVTSIFIMLMCMVGFVFVIALAA